MTIIAAPQRPIGINLRLCDKYQYNLACLSVFNSDDDNTLTKHLISVFALLLLIKSPTQVTHKHDT